MIVIGSPATFAGVALIALASSGAARAQHMNAPDSPCAGVEVTADLVACLDRAYRNQDAVLNKTYQDVMGVLAPAERTQLRDVQRLWLSYRDAQCTAEHDMFGGGTAGPPAELACREAAVRARIASLKAGYGWRLAQALPRPSPDTTPRP